MNENKDIQEIMKQIRHFRVKNMQSARGNDVPNQFIIYGRNFRAFQSYNSLIAIEYEGKTYIFSDWDYSVTTGKYRNEFLGEGIAETRRKLKSGEYIAVDFEVC